MTDHSIPAVDREPILSEDDDAMVASVVAGHDHGADPPTQSPWRDRKVRKVLYAAAIAVACFSIASVVATIAQFVNASQQNQTISAQGKVIDEQGQTIDVERTRSQQLERQTAGLQSQVSDQQNQTLCRAQIANDYESIHAQLESLVERRDQLFRESLTAALSQDIDGFKAKLAEAGDLDPQVAVVQPQVDAAVQARQESVQTCQKASTATTTTPG